METKTQPLANFWQRHDIRGVIGDEFNQAEFADIGRAYAAFIQGHARQAIDRGQWVAVGHDARLHSVALTQALIQGLTQSGVNVLFLGLATSPLVYFAEYLHALDSQHPELSGVLVVTASHNPAAYNGVKFTIDKRSFAHDDMVALRTIYSQLPPRDFEILNTVVNAELITGSNQADNSKHAIVKRLDVIPLYQDWMAKHFAAVKKQAKLKVVVDSGNATAGIVSPAVFRQLGCEVVELFSEPDGRFPNHHPDPCVHKNLVDLIDAVKASGADVGFAFDGDADRLGVVDNAGNILPGDLITLFLAEGLLKSQPGKTIIFDIKSTQSVAPFLQSLGGASVLSPSGHVVMKQMMQAQNILLGGELSGHLFFRDRHWGFDDALYAACRFVETLAAVCAGNPNYRLSDFMESLPPSIISEELRLACTAEQASGFMAVLRRTLAEQPDFLGLPIWEILTLDGIRANFDGGFLLARQSGTESCVTLRFEAPDLGSYQRIEQRLEALRAPYFTRHAI